MDNIKWSEWEVAGKTFLYDEVKRRTSSQEFYVWRGDHAERISGTVVEWRCFIKGSEVEGARITTAHAGTPEHLNLFGPYRSDAHEEGNVLGFTELECLDKVRELRRKYLDQAEEKYKTACELYTRIISDIDKLTVVLSLIDEPGSHSA